jgi:hypothetical protein
VSRPALLLALLALLAAPAAADEDVPEAHAFLQIVTPRERVFVGEAFTLTLRLGIDRAYFDEHAVELFRRPLDLPVQVEAPWLATPPGARALDEAPRAGGVRLALGGREVRGVRVADAARDERSFEVVEVSRRCLAEAEGTYSLDATLRFAHAARFEEDFLGVRVAVDRRDVRVVAPTFALRVEALPGAGRPALFGGAVGRYAVTASLAPASSGPAGSLALTLVIEGEGNLAFVDPPAPERLTGFHVYGLVDDHGAPRRTVVYEIAPLPGTAAVPAIPFAFFDPGPPAAYRVARTDPVPLEMPATAAPPAGEAAPPAAFPWSWLLGAAGLVLAGLAFARLGRRRAARSAAGPSPATWIMRLEAPGADPTRALTEALAEHLGVAPAAVVGPGLAARLVAAGVETDLAARTARTVEALVGARFGGAAEGPTRPDVADLLTSLDAALRRAEGEVGVR